MALKNVGKHFSLWPKQGNKIGGVVLNKVRVSNSKRLTYTQILVEFPRGSMRYRTEYVRSDLRECWNGGKKAYRPDILSVY